MKVIEKILIVVGGLKDRGYEIKYFDKDDYGRYRIDIKRREDDFWQSEEYKEYERILGDSLIEGTYGSDIYTLWIKADEEQPETSCKSCGFYENNCPFIRGKFIPYPNKVCKDYTYSVMKEQPEVDLEKK